MEFRWLNCWVSWPKSSELWAISSYFFHQRLAKAKESEAHGKNAEVDDGSKLKLAAVVAYF